MLKLLWIAACLIAISSCADKRPLEIKAAPAPIVLAPPDTLLQDCPPLYKGPFETTRDLDRRMTTAEAARNICNEDKKSLRQWKAESIAATTAQ